MGALVLAGILAAAPVRAQPSDAPALTLAQLVDLALSRVVGVQAARARIAEARALRVGAGLRDNPTVEGAAGPRFHDGGTGLELEVGATLPLDVPGRRARRLAVAAARLTQAEAELEVARREVALAVIEEWARLGAAQGALDVSRAAVALAQELVAAVEGREAAGTASGLDRVMAEAELAKARAQLAAQQREVVQARARLARLVGAPEALTAPLDVDLTSLAELGDAVPEVAPVQLEALAARADVARAETTLARAAALPDVAVGAWYAQEEGAHIATAGVSVTLPVFDRGQGDLALARAQEATAAAEREAAERRLVATRQGAALVFRQAAEATRLTRDEVVPRADRAVEMAREAYLAGKIDLTTVITLRRQALEARAALQERLLVQALAGVAVWSASGAPLPFDDSIRTDP